jgi:hypothetical protein
MDGIELKDKILGGIIHNVSSLTHVHKRSLIACGIYLIVADSLLVELDLKKSSRFQFRKSKIVLSK